MKLKNKKKILPTTIILLLLFSIISPLVLSQGIFIGPARWNPAMEVARESQENATNAWNVSEHFRDGTADEYWNVSHNKSSVLQGTPWTVNDSKWNLNDYPGYDFGYSLMWNNSSGRAGDEPFHWAIVNYSNMNRSQSLVFAQTQNWSIDGGEIYYGYIFKANNSSANPGEAADNMTAVLYGPRKCYILQFDNSTGVIRDVESGAIITTNESTGLTNYYNDISWMLNATERQKVSGWPDDNDGCFGNGTWIKTIFNSHCGYLQSKLWGNGTYTRFGFLDEPSGWVVNETVANVSTNDSAMVGLCVWNPNGIQAVVQFDMFEMWRLNYTLNSSVDWSVAEGGRPHMNFPIVNASSVNDSLVTLFWEAIGGNLTMDNITDFWISLTNNMSMESRPYYPNPNDAANPTASSDLQDDTIYYYTAIISNANAFFEYWFDENPFIGNPDDILWIWVHDTPQVHEDIAGLNFLFISVDTDNDGEYNVWDRAFLASDLVWGTWTGLVPDAAPEYFYNQTYEARGIQNLHRYNQHLYYNVMIPLSEFPHGSNTSGNYLGVNDTFGLNIVTSNEMWDQRVAFWQNYNESNCSTHVNEAPAIAKPFYMNSTFIQHGLPLTINSTNVERWGEGHIVYNSVEGLRGAFTVTVVKSANVSAISSGLTTDTSHIVNYSINVSNTNTGTLTNVQINDTWFSCGSCSDFNMTWLNNTWNNTNTGITWRVNAANVSWNNASCYWLINIMNLDEDQYFNLTFQVDLRTCDNDTRAIVTNTATVTCDQVGVTDSDSHGVRWATTESLRIRAITSVFDVVALADSVITILGIVLIIGAIMAIVGLVYSYRDML